MFLDLYEETPYKALKYLIGSLNYGGRVTDEWDLRLINCILDDFVCDKIVENDDYKFDSGGIYHAPTLGSTHDEVMEYINTMPLEDPADVFGLHDNVNITTAIKESTALCIELLNVQPRSSGGGGGLSRDDLLLQKTQSILDRLPEQFDVRAAQKKYPVVYDNSMNTVLCQELIRFNKLTTRVKGNLVNVQRAVKGEIVMSDELEKAADSMFNDFVPALWHQVSYPSLKPLAGWIADLLQRLQMFSTWIEEGCPTIYWLSGFFFTQSFLTGTMQNYARCYKVAIDGVDYDFEIMPHITAECKEPPKDGCYINGLFLEGARWDAENMVIAEPLKRQLYSICPTIWLKPMEQKDIPQGRLEYPCPVYKTSQRFGVLSTTGRSTNYVIAVTLTSQVPASHWTKRGVALLCQLDT